MRKTSERDPGGVIQWHSTDDGTESTAAEAGSQGPPGGECWVCLSAAGEAVTATDRSQQLMRGCACRGTAGLAHLQCLVDAAKHKPSMWSHCPSCKQRYTGQLLLELSRCRWDVSMHARRPERIEFSEAVLELRQRVMWPDRPLSYSAVDGDDTEAQHYGIYARATTRGMFEGETIEDKLVSVVSVWLSADGTEAQFRKFCTSAEMQRKGLGVQLLSFALASLRRGQPPIKRVWCNARVEQIGFYSKHFGMHEIADSRFEKGGREYVMMERSFTAGSDNGDAASVE